MTDCVLTFACPNRPGIVAGVATCLFKQGADITEAQQFDDAESGRFFMRTVFAAIEQEMQPIAARSGMEWRLHNRT